MHEFDYRVRLTEDDDGSILLETEDMNEAFDLAEAESRNLVVEYLNVTTNRWITISEFFEGQEITR